MGTESADHTHSFNVNTGGRSAAHTHAISGSTDNGPGTGTALATPPPTQVFNYIIFAGA